MIVVTGATGHVGREIVEKLVGRGREVRALTRNPAEAGLPDGVQVVPGDPGDQHALSTASPSPRSTPPTSPRWRPKRSSTIATAARPTP